MISEFPLFAFTVLTGIACGAYVAAAVFPAKEDKRPWLLPVVALVFLVCGGLCSMMHLARPERILNVLNHFASPLTLEGLCTGVMVVIAIVDLMVCIMRKQSMRAVRTVGAVGALAFMAVVTHAYVTSYGNVAWCDASTLPLFFAGDLAAGFALWAALAPAGQKAQPMIVALLAVLLCLNLVWEAMAYGELYPASVGLIGAGAVLSTAAAVVAMVGRSKGRGFAIAVAVLVIAAVMVSRYGFYAASVI